MKRRHFLYSSASAAACTLFGRLSHGAEKLQERFRIRQSRFWKGDVFHQDNVDASRIEEGTIRARIEGKWQSFTLRTFDEAFMEWNIKDRLANLEEMREGRMPDWSGAHNAAVATYGRNRGDSRFHLNNAIKGTGLCPKHERLEELITRLSETRDKPHQEKFTVLESMYKDTDLWDRRMLVSLELYSKPDFETHTFLNQMENPVSTIVFLDIPSYELRTIARLCHPEDPELLEPEKRIVTYINTIHTYMHSHFKDSVPAVVYHVIEEFDNSPAGRGGQGKKGLRVV